MFRLAWFHLLFLVPSILHAQEHPDVKTLQPGQKAPDFNLPATDGKSYSLEDFKNAQLLVIVFTCNHCPTAQAYEKRLISLADTYRSKGVEFVAISPNDPSAISLSELGYSDLSDNLEEMKIRAKDMNYNFPYLYDGETQEASISYGPVATPHAFVFDKNRILRYSGRIDDTENPYVAPKNKDLRNALDALLSGKEPEAAVTKTFGCSIKWAWKNDWVQKQRDEWSGEPVSLNEITREGIRTLMQNDSDNLRLVNVWATWCGPCVIEFPEFVNINRMYRDRDFEFISISADKPDKKDKALRFLTKKEASNRNYLYSGGDVYEMIDAVDPAWQGALPFTVLIAPGGEVLYKIDGPIDPLVVKQKIVGYLGRYYADTR